MRSTDGLHSSAQACVTCFTHEWHGFWLPYYDRHQSIGRAPTEHNNSSPLRLVTHYCPMRHRANACLWRRLRSQFTRFCGIVGARNGSLSRACDVFLRTQHSSLHSAYTCMFMGVRCLASAISHNHNPSEREIFMAKTSRPHNYRAKPIQLRAHSCRRNRAPRDVPQRQTHRQIFAEFYGAIDISMSIVVMRWWSALEMTK